MAKTIGNPLSWGAQALGRGGHHLAEMADQVQGNAAAGPPVVCSIDGADIGLALRKGLEDFTFFRSDVMFLCLIYPVIGLTMVWAAFNAELAPFIFPMIAGFALLGPVAAIGLYELSRRREAGLPASWGDALNLIRSPSVGAIFLLGLYLLALFGAWMGTAYLIFLGTMGPDLPVSTIGFLRDVITTPEGWTMILLGIPAGAVFAGVVLSISIVAFPLLLDRQTGLALAVVTSLRVTRANPGAVILWGLIVAVSLAIAAIPFFLGLIVVMPVLGHATWHLYRRAIG
jgi:uncharacterized membrane protein